MKGAPRLVRIGARRKDKSLNDASLAQMAEARARARKRARRGREGNASSLAF